MTDYQYPTAAEIDAARGTLKRLYGRVDTRSVLNRLAREALWDAASILDALDDVAGLYMPAPSPEPEPEPEPKPTAAEVLRWAHERLLGLGLSAEMQIIGAAVTYAEAHPEWFVNWHKFSRRYTGLLSAADKAQAAGDSAAGNLLRAAAEVASEHPHLFGGAS